MQFQNENENKDNIDNKTKPNKNIIFYSQLGMSEKNVNIHITEMYLQNVVIEIVIQNYVKSIQWAFNQGLQ